MTEYRAMLLNKSLANAKQAQADWSRYGGETADEKSATAAILTFIRIAQAQWDGYQNERNAQRAAIEREVILQADIYGCGLTRKIVVAKPNDRTDEPFIPESFYRAIRDKWAMKDGERLTTTAPYDIAVVDRHGRKIEHIHQR